MDTLIIRSRDEALFSWGTAEAPDINIFHSSQSGCFAKIAQFESRNNSEKQSKVCFHYRCADVILNVHTNDQNVIVVISMFTQGHIRIHLTSVEQKNGRLNVFLIFK